MPKTPSLELLWPVSEAVFSDKSPSTLVKDQIFFDSKLEKLVYFFLSEKPCPTKTFKRKFKASNNSKLFSNTFQNPLKLIEDIFFEQGPPGPSPDLD